MKEDASTVWRWRLHSSAEPPEENAGEPFAFPEGKSVDLGGFFREPGGQLVLTAERSCSAPAPEQLVLAAEGRWRLRFNGELLLDSTACGSQEFPFQPDSYPVTVDCRAGVNTLVWEIFGERSANGGFAPLRAAFRSTEPPPPLTMRYAPVATFPDGGERAVSILFTGSRPSAAAVDYRRRGGTQWRRAFDNLGGQIRCDRAVHAIRLTGLNPDADYEYRAVLIDEFRRLKDIVVDGIHRFRSAPDRGRPFRFVMTADLQIPEERTKYLKTLFPPDAPDAPDFFVFGGDLHWTTDFNRSVMEEFILPFRQCTGNRVPLVMVRGNHELYGRESLRYFDSFSAPPPGREGYTLFRWGEVCFFVLDFCDDAGNLPRPSTRWLHDFEPYLAAEARWLRRAVELPLCRDAKFRIVLAHGLPYGDAQSYLPDHVRQLIDPLFGGAHPAVQIHL